MKNLVAALARACARHRLLVVLVWVGVVGALFATAFLIGPTLQDDVEVSGSDSQTANRLLEERGDSDDTGTPTSRIVVAGDDIATHADAIDEVVTALEEATGEEIENPLDDVPTATRTGVISPDGDALTLSVPGDPKEEGRAWQGEVDAALDPARDAGLEVAIGSPLGTQLDRAGGVNSELVGVIAALVVLLIALGSALAALVPVATGIIAVAGGASGVWLLSHGFGIPESAVTLAVMVGLGVGIDYALFLLSRFRQSLREGAEVIDAVAATGRGAGEAAAIAGITVALCATGLAISGVEFVAWLGFATAIVALVAVAATLTLTPAVLALIGRRALPRRERPASDAPAPPRGGWDRIAPRLTRHPVVAGAAAIAALAAVSLPALSLELGQSSAGNALPGSNQRATFDLTAEHWGAGQNSPLLIVAEGDDADLWGSLNSTIAARDDVASVSRASAQNGIITMQVIPTSGPNDAATAQLVDDLRTDVIPATGIEAHVGGVVATRLDLSDRIAERLPWLIGIVIAAAMALVAFTFRSVLLPLKAAVCNVLSITAAFGAIVWVFQEGHGVELFGLDGPMPLDPYVPMMLFAVLFGLSMDYEVFLLTAVRQAWQRGVSPRDAVTEGLARTGGVISAAAIIMIAVFLSFTFSANPVIKVFGVGLAVAVFIDATVIRLLLVPAVMTLMGRAAWWWPGRGRERIAADV
ncbi:MMPL family transporter [Homoserinibacter sp. GY 40078]|uniref:MMPL family transporter n=1 Tax=Homoserinibacter sp. GY 40078 TaxID=2603275 RepID=UPI0011C908E3|nr:MMPL family transporter [Homoserinibacter sp. GY 40078]TXK16361.1 MMPL family transporter [Homoserinibacter sp. GY 40078]